MSFRANFHLLLVCPEDEFPSYAPMTGGLLEELVSVGSMPPGEFLACATSPVAGPGGEHVTDGSVTVGDIIHLTLFAEGVAIGDEWLAAARSAKMLLARLIPERLLEPPPEPYRVGEVVPISTWALSEFIRRIRVIKKIPNPIADALAAMK